jgi:hypothetical protein
MEHRIMVLDTEAVSLEGPVYDVGYTITTKAGKILTARTWLVEEVFTNPRKMMGAYFAAKFFTHYAYMLQAGRISLIPWMEIVAEMQSDVEYFGVTGITAYNFQFDRKVMRATHRLHGDGSMFMPPMRQLCLWKWLKATKLSTQTYKNWCRENGYMTRNHRPKTTAELAYRYISGEHNYQEPHTALGDALMETELLVRQFRSKQRIPWL